MFTIITAVILFAGSAVADTKPTILLKASEETALIYNRKDIEISESFYHFSKEDKVIIKKDAKPMIICSYVNEKLHCEKGIMQLIDMPMLSIWALNSI